MMKVIRQLVQNQQTRPKMINHKFLGTGLLLLVLLMLTGCGEDAFVCTEDDGCVDTSTTTTTGFTATATMTSTGVRIGSWSTGVSGSGSFNEGTVYADAAAVDPVIGTATLSISLVENDYSQYTPAANIPFTITFTCVDSSVDANPTANAGADATVSATYTAGSCNGTTDTITVTTTVDGDPLTATFAMTINP